MQIIKRGKVFAQLTGVGAGRFVHPCEKPDIMARLKEVWGDRMFSMEEVQAMRAAELEEEEDLAVPLR